MKKNIPACAFIFMIVACNSGNEGSDTIVLDSSRYSDSIKLDDSLRRVDEAFNIDDTSNANETFADTTYVN